MYMNLKPNKHKIISFNITTMASLGFIGPPKNFKAQLKFSPPPPKFNFLLRSPPPPPPYYFGLKFLGTSIPKIRGGCYHVMVPCKSDT